MMMSFLSALSCYAEMLSPSTDVSANASTSSSKRRSRRARLAEATPTSVSFFVSCAAFGLVLLLSFALVPSVEAQGRSGAPRAGSRGAPTTERKASRYTEVARYITYRSLATE